MGVGTAGARPSLRGHPAWSQMAAMMSENAWGWLAIAIVAVLKYL